MDDALKLQKLAAARNKLKSHQQKKQKKPEDTPMDSASDSTLPEPNDMSVNMAEHAEFIPIQVPTPTSNPSPVPQIQSYFGGATATFFDNVNVQIAPIAAVEVQQPQTVQMDSVSYEDPEIVPNEIFNFANVNAANQIQTVDNAQVTQVVQVDTNGYDSNYSDVEKRNLELADNFEREKLQCNQLNTEIADYRMRVADLEYKMTVLKQECEHRIIEELRPLELEVEAHRATIGILVNEKTELADILENAEEACKDKDSECEELKARLKNSRSRVASLEHEITAFKDERGKYAQMQSGHSQEFDKLQQELRHLQIAKGETEQDLSEMRERLRKSQEENALTSINCKDFQSKLELTTVKIQQLTAGTDSSASDHFTQEKNILEKQISDLNVALKNALGERDQASLQYQQYVQQLNGSISTLAEQLENANFQKENLLKRENELVQHIGELEKRFQSVQQETANIYKQQYNSEASKEPNQDFEIIKTKLAELETENIDLQHKFEAAINERDEFIKDVEQKKHAIEDLEMLIERLKGSQTNNTQLLAEIESEKVAASRAVEQNMKLKLQLEEMQEAFIRMTNDKAELLTQLTSEQFRFKELEDLQLHTSTQLHTLSEAIEIKDRELTEMRSNAENLSKEALKQDQLNDRLRHYEAHEHSAHALRHELQLAREEIQVLTNKNKQLEVKLARKHEEHQIIEAIPEEDEETSENQLQSVCIQTESVNFQTPNLKSDMEMTPAREIAMRQLETKFMRTMQEIANLQDEKQMLEHLVLQLQGETETIGEYIALYQHQRGVLKQRAIEKETQLKQLAIDREHMKEQLQTLNELIRRLLDENKISDGVLKEQQLINKSTVALCDEHAKLHQEMQAQDGHGNYINGGHGGETAQQIMALLGEIKASNLVQPTDVSDSFHPCPLCSGQLITV